MKIGATIRKYRKEKGLTQEEITAIIMEANQRLKTSTYGEVFYWIKSTIEAYPNCPMLIWQLATLLDARRLFKEIPNAIDYDEFLLRCYNRVLESDNSPAAIFSD